MSAAPEAPSRAARPNGATEEPSWQSYLALDEAPDSHHYKSQTTGKLTKAFTDRVMYERDILSTALPPNILVRAFDDRLDLLRCLIIGPIGTPFANAPFLFDLHLPPSTFPKQPPSMYFYSWSGNTRISPNLYTSGYVCLSLLGTWAGSGVELWNSSKSTILQLLVSIQGLVMVRQPYFTEPGYEASKGSAQAEMQSDIYDENTFALTRDFVRRACEWPSRTFTTEIEHFYLRGSVLKTVIEQSRGMVAESERHSAGAGQAGTGANGSGGRAMPPSEVVAGLKVMSPSACALLKTTLGELERVARARGKNW